MLEINNRQLKVSQTLILSGFLVILGLFISQEAWAFSCANVPVSGNYTATTTDPVIKSCTFSGTVDGVENGNLIIPSGATLTINQGQTIVWNSGYTVIINGSIAINKTGGAQLRKTKIWLTDTDKDGYPDNTTMVAQDTAPTSDYLHRYQMAGTYVSNIIVDIAPSNACATSTTAYYHDCGVDNGSGGCTTPKTAGDYDLAACQTCNGTSLTHVNVATFNDSVTPNTCAGTCAAYCNSGSCVNTNTSTGTCTVATDARVASAGDGHCTSSDCIADCSSNGASCSTGTQCCSNNCVTAIDSGSKYCAPSSDECSRNGYSDGYDTGETYTTGGVSWICKGADLGGSACGTGTTGQCDEYASYYCNGAGTWTSGDSSGTESACAVCTACPTGTGDLSCTAITDNTGDSVGSNQCDADNGDCYRCLSGSCTSQTSGQDLFGECTQGVTTTDGCTSNTCSGTGYSCGIQNSTDGGCPTCQTCSDTDIACEYYADTAGDSGCNDASGTCYRCNGSGSCTYQTNAQDLWTECTASGCTATGNCSGSGYSCGGNVAAGGQPTGCTGCYYCDGAGTCAFCRYVYVGLQTSHPYGSNYMTCTWANRDKRVNSSSTGKEACTNNLLEEYGSSWLNMYLYDCICGKRANGLDCTVGTDCISGNCYVDVDGDRYTVVSGTKLCQANSQLSGTDCNDGNASIYPGTSGSSPCSYCNTSGSITYQTVDQDLFNECPGALGICAATTCSGSYGCGHLTGEQSQPTCKECNETSYDPVNIANGSKDEVGSNLCNAVNYRCDGSGNCDNPKTTWGYCEGEGDPPGYYCGSWSTSDVCPTNIHTDSQSRCNAACSVACTEFVDLYAISCDDYNGCFEEGSGVCWFTSSNYQGIERTHYYCYTFKYPN